MWTADFGEEEPELELGGAESAMSMIANTRRTRIRIGNEIDGNDEEEALFTISSLCSYKQPKA